MRRVLAVLLAVVGLGLASIPTASAAVTLTLNPAATTIVEGTSTTLRGFASGARLGTVVELQRKLDGAWRTVRERRLRSSRAYAFTVSPRRGIHRFRVLERRQLGQPRTVSPTATVTVRWRPRVVIQTSYELPYEVGVHATVAGAPYTSLVEQRRFHPDAAWFTTRTVRTDAQGELDMTYDDGWYELRYLVPAEGLRLSAVSPVVEVTHEDELSHQAVVTGEGGAYGDHGGLAIKAEAGQQVYLAVTDSSHYLDGREELLRPDGRPVPITFRRGDEGLTGTFRAPVTGWYTLLLGESSSKVTASLAKPVPVTPNGPRPFEGALLDGQPVDLVFDGTAGDIMTWGPGPARECVTETMYEPDGSVTAPFRRGAAITWQAAWMLGTTGEHRLRIAPCEPHELDEDLTLHRGVPVDLPLDGAAEASTTRVGQAAVAEITLQQGDRFLGAAEGGRWTPLLTVVAPSGQPLHTEWVNARNPDSPGLFADTTGLYRVVYFWDDTYGDIGLTATSPRTVPSTLDPRKPVTVATSNPRELGVTFTGRAGQLVNGFTSWYLRDLEDQTLLGPDGTVVPPTYEVARRVWRLPADGSYTLLSAGTADGDVAAMTATPGPELTRGAVTRMEVQQPSETVVGHFAASVGETLTFDVDSHTFPLYIERGEFVLDVYSPSGSHYRVAAPGTSEPYRPITFPAAETGTYSVVLQGSHVDTTGTVDLAFDAG